MSTGTKIGWTEATWNPTTGCDRVSPGCDHCYALTMAARLKAAGQAKYQRDGNPATSGPGFGLATHADVLDQPLRWRKPRMVFVNSMSDLFHDRVPGSFIAEVWDVMRRCPQHVFQVLTKRHARMRSLLTKWSPVTGTPPGTFTGPWPLRNVWCGVSVEDQRWADIRIPALEETPAAVRFVSVEPMLGPVSLHRYLPTHPSGAGNYPTQLFAGRYPAEVGQWKRDVGLDWVIVGGESGPGYRPMDLTWLFGLAEQCTQAGIPLYVKQDSGPKPGKQGRIPDELWRRKEYPRPAHNENDTTQEERNPSNDDGTRTRHRRG